MITQRVDDDHEVLGFTTDWIAALATHVEQLDVLTAYEGSHDLPANVAVHSYGKERGVGKLRRVVRFEATCARLSTASDVVFVHMIPKFVVAGWPWFRSTGTPILLWYAHSSVTWDLKLAHRMVDRVVTPTAESFRLPSDKLEIVGHGIAADRFGPGPSPAGRTRTELLYVGRVDPVKNVDTLIEAVHELQTAGRTVSLRIVGSSSGHPDYVERLRELVRGYELEDAVEFVGAVPYDRVPSEYHGAGLFVNASRTGSLDKTEIEAMLSRTPVVSCNDSYREFVGACDLDEALLTFPPGDAAALANRIEELLSISEEQYTTLAARSRESAVANHTTDSLMESIASLLADLRG